MNVTTTRGCRQAALALQISQAELLANGGYIDSEMRLGYALIPAFEVAEQRLQSLAACFGPRGRYRSLVLKHWKSSVVPVLPM